jgi:hypothetical protein
MNSHPSPYPDIDRAQITAILIRLISELAGDDVDSDPAFAEIAHAIIELCCKSHLQCSDDEGRRLWNETLDRLEQKEAWFLAVESVRGILTIETKFGHTIKMAQLPKHWIGQSKQ